MNKSKNDVDSCELEQRSDRSYYNIKVQVG